MIHSTITEDLGAKACAKQISACLNRFRAKVIMHSVVVEALILEFVDPWWSQAPVMQFT